MPTEIEEKFYQSLNRDMISPQTKEWMNKWYWKELCPQFGASDKYTGLQDLVNWYKGQTTCRIYHNIISGRLISDLTNKSVKLDKRVFESTELRNLQGVDSINFENYGIYNAQDYLYPKLFADLCGVEVKTLVDFGAGSGRQFNLWSQDENAKTLISIDGIAQTYCMQNAYYRMLSPTLNDYIEQPEGAFQIKRGVIDLCINHAPSWRLDLIESASVDLIVTVQVLGELRPEMAEHTVTHFNRMLCQGGLLYVRDHGALHNPNGVNINELIASKGFTLEYKPNLVDLKEIHGIPKIWRKLS